MLSKLRRRFILDMMIMALVILIGSATLLTVATYVYGRNTSNEQMSSLLSGVSKETVHLSKDGATVDREELAFKDDLALVIVSEDGEVLCVETPSKTLRSEFQNDLDQTIAEVLAAGSDTGLAQSKSLRFMKQPWKGVGTKVAIMDRSGETGSLYYQFRIYVVLAFIILVLMLILSDVLARRSILPVDEAIRNQQQFIADASHELKTPLSVMLANLDIIGASPDATVRETGKWLENTKQEAGRMSKLVNEMLFLARSDAAMDMHYNFRLIDMADVVDEVILSTEALAYERNIRLESSVNGPAEIVGDHERLKQVVMILMENAAKYVDENGVIRVGLTSTPRRTVVLTVSNTGTPIPPDKAEHIFDRFFRVDEARTREQGGYGLGLSIAQKIVQKHNGEIGLDYSDENGTRFSVKLPHAQNLRAPDLSAPVE